VVKNRGMRVVNVVGARPNMMKIAPIVEEMGRYPDIEPILVHTGQHYDDNLSQVFLRDLNLPEPDIYLGVGSDSHARQMARIMVEFEGVLLDRKPDLILVVGDVNSTLACAVTAAKVGVPIAHVEAGLRSFNRRMPEEINRVVTDALSDLLFTTCEDANLNLNREGIPEEKIFFAGNVMIDTLLKHRQKAMHTGILERLHLKKGEYVVLTLHRPSNVDDREAFLRIIQALKWIEAQIKVVFPAHPRTVKRVQEFGLQERFDGMSNLLLLEPLGYLDFLGLMSQAKFVLTDSGGIQEETTVLQIPCLTLREQTERPVTVTEGTNVVVGSRTERIIEESGRILNGEVKKGKVPKLWDGKAGERIVGVLRQRWWT